MNSALYRNTPTVTVFDNRGMTVRNIAYYRHPDTLEVTNERITRHQYDDCGFLSRSTDPRLYDTGLANFTYLTDLAGTVLRTVSVDAGTSVVLNDAVGRPFIAISNISTVDDGTEDRGQAVTRIWQYEDAALPGRPLSIMETTADGKARVAERFVYAGHSDAEKGLNLAGACISHYDTAGLIQTDSVSLTGVPMFVTRRLLKNAASPDTVADWQGKDASAWNVLLDSEAYTTLTTTNATGALLTTMDAEGNQQRISYDVAGLLAGSWLTLKDGKEQIIVKSLTYSAAGKKRCEEHGNGVVTTYAYEAETQRLTGIKTERPAGHASGAKVLQDLRYEYDPVGNVLKITDDSEEPHFWRNQRVVPENTYTYDSLYQLVSATGREMANATQQGSGLPSTTIPLPADSSACTNYIRTYTYDNAGNLTQMRHSAPATNNRYSTDITISNRSNRGVLSTMTKNASGVDELFTAGGQQTQLQPGQSLIWTPRNELLKVMLVVRDGKTDDDESYRYDSNSQRILKVSVQKTGAGTQTQRVVYLPGLELRSTKNGNTEKENLQVITVGEASWAQVRVLHWDSGKPVDIVNGQVRYSYGNLIGSDGLELDGQGLVISQEEYYPYGGTAILTARSQSEVNYKTVRYSGKEQDATGLYYYGYRYYQPWAGRWLSADPAGMVDGLNLFKMVRNNPVSNFDSTGLITVDDLINEGISRNEIQIAFQNENLWGQLMNGIKAIYTSLPDEEFTELSQDAQAQFNNVQAVSKINVLFDMDEDIADDLNALFDINTFENLAVSKHYHRTIKREIKKYGGGVIFRGDKRSPDIILKEGFTPKGTNKNLTKYVHSNEESIFVSFSTEEKVARKFAARDDAEGYVYIVERPENYIDVNKCLLQPGAWQDEFGNSLGRRFYEYAMEIAIPHGVGPSKIIKAYHVNGNKRYE